MGLEEKRAIKAFQEAQFPGLMKEVQVYVSCPVEVDWETLMTGEGLDPAYWGEAFEKVYFRSVIEGLKKLACDDMGREALKAGVKKIELSNKSGQCGRDAISFENGILKVDHEPFTNVDDVSQRAEYIASLLIEAL